MEIGDLIVDDDVEAEDDDLKMPALVAEESKADDAVESLRENSKQDSRMLVMVQREVAERFAAAPSSPAYGAVSVKAAYWGQPRIVGRVPASVFVPRPNVESALLRIDRREPLRRPAGLLQVGRGGRRDP